MFDSIFSEALRYTILFDFECLFVTFQRGFLRRIEACMREASVLKSMIKPQVFIRFSLIECFDFEAYSGNVSKPFPDVC